jgi:hypothetical protein
MTITRRQVVGAGAALLAGLGGAGPAGAGPQAPDALDAAWLQAELDLVCRRLDPATRVTLSAVTVSDRPDGSGTRIDLSLRLDWAPGFRIVPYDAVGADRSAAFRALRDRIAGELTVLHMPRSRQQVQVRRA